jgi:hypothetical protein
VENDDDDDRVVVVFDGGGSGAAVAVGLEAAAECRSTPPLLIF